MFGGGDYEDTMYIARLFVPGRRAMSFSSEREGSPNEIHVCVEGGGYLGDDRFAFFTRYNHVDRSIDR